MALAPPPAPGPPAPAGAARPTLHYELSLALHAAVANALDAETVERARAVLARWLERGGPGTPLLRRWREVLELPLPDIGAFLTDPGEEAAWLRKASPFAGMLAPRERERIIRGVRARMGTPR